MAPVHISLVGAIIAFVFAFSVAGVIYWMLKVPEQTPTTLRVAKAIRQAARANLVLVPVQGTALSDRMVALGCQMAKARQARIEVFYVIEVPWTLPIDAKLPDAEQMAQDELSRAKRIADRYGVQLETRVANAREAGRAIVEEAVADGADIILMGDVPQRHGRTRFSATTGFVFTYAPCEVIIDRPALEQLNADRPLEATTRGR
jgi:nucleotide-binding universal stress UspA family protein